MATKKQRPRDEYTEHLPPGATMEQFENYHRLKNLEAAMYGFAPWEFFAVHLHPASKWALHGPAMEEGVLGEIKSFEQTMAESWARARQIRLHELSKDPHHYDLANKYLAAHERELDQHGTDNT